jgi:putative hydrolase of the HAD superfamily
MAVAPQIILFDVDGVLIHGYHARLDLRRCWDENLMRDFGIDRIRFTDEFIHGSFMQVLAGECHLREALAQWLHDIASNADPDAFIAYWLANDAHINQPLLKKIAQLKDTGKVRLFIATNQEHNRAHYLMRDLGFSSLFEDIFYSARIGALKPDDRYFEWISARLSLANDQKIIFFDDTPSVITRATAHGWEAIEYTELNDLNRSAVVRDILSTGA